MKTVAMVKEVNEIELVATWTPHDIEVKVGDWLGIKKEWQGLTAQEIASIPLNEYTVQTVERMLKEKNNAM